MKFHVKTLGCKVNQAESEKIINDLKKHGLIWSRPEEAEIMVVNSCTVTSKADGKSASIVKRSWKNKKIKHVFITGCFSELEKELISRVETKVSQVILHKDKDQTAQLILKYLGQINQQQLSDYTSSQINKIKLPVSKSAYGKMHKISADSIKIQQSEFQQHTRAFVKIQDGCNAFCSFCRIPFARGVPISRDKKDILLQIDHLLKKNIPEIVLTGVNIGVYKNSNEDFAGLINTILEKLKSSNTLLRISTIEPHSINNRIIELYQHPNLVNSLHIALQSGSNTVLNRMNRKYTVEEFKTILKKLETIDPYFSILTDVIVGFCGETEEEFNQTLQFINESSITQLHVFPYSARPLTKAYQWKDSVSSKIKQERAKKLRQISNEKQIKYRVKMLNIPQRFIIEEVMPPHHKEINKQFEENKNKIFLYHPNTNADNFFWAKGISEYYLKGISFLPKVDKNIKNFKKGSYHITAFINDKLCKVI